MKGKSNILSIMVTNKRQYHYHPYLSKFEEKTSLLNEFFEFFALAIDSFLFKWMKAMLVR